MVTASNSRQMLADTTYANLCHPNKLSVNQLLYVYDVRRAS